MVEQRNAVEEEKTSRRWRGEGIEEEEGGVGERERYKRRVGRGSKEVKERRRQKKKRTGGVEGEKKSRE